MHGPLSLTSAFFLVLLLAGDNVLITRNGEKFEGPVTREGGDYVVQTAGGPKRIPEAEVGLVFDNLRDVLHRADERFREAKRLYEEASQMDDANPARNQKLQLAIEISQGVVGIYQHLQPHYTGPSYASIPNGIQVVMQFIRLCRGASTSDVAAGTAKAGTSTVVVLDDTPFTFTPPAAADRPWVVAGDLGAGLGAASQELAHPDAARRLEAVKRLTHPPSPLHLAGLLRLLETEKDPPVLAALAGGLGLMDSAIVTKALGWVKRETEPHRRGAAFAILHAAGDRAAFEFLTDWFEESPPAGHPDRAAFASLFRRFHASSIPYLKDLLTRNRSPKIQAEAIRQLGVIGDKSAAPMLVKTIGGYAKESAVSLLKLGKPSIPTLLEGARSTDNETRRICHYFLQKFTGIRQQNLSHFETWWSMNRKAVQEEEKSWWDEQAKKEWPVDPKTFATYDLPMESIVP